LTGLLSSGEERATIDLHQRHVPRKFGIDRRGNGSLRRLERLRLVLYLLHPCSRRQPLPALLYLLHPCSRALAGKRSISPSQALPQISRCIEPLCASKSENSVLAFPPCSRRSAESDRLLEISGLASSSALRPESRAVMPHGHSGRADQGSVPVEDTRPPNEKTLLSKIHCRL
jgi:hypothetical protein